MKLTNFISFGAVLAMAVTPIAASQAQSVTSGDYMVVRGGKVVSVAAGEQLLNGDRVVTRGSSGAKVALSGCSLDMPAAASLTVDANSCTNNIASLSTARAGYSVDANASALRGGFIVPLVAVIAIILGILAATSSSDRPHSP